MSFGVTRFNSKPVGASTALAMVAALVVPLSGTAVAGHVATVTVTPATTVVAAEQCEPIVVQTTGGTSPTNALVDVEVRSTKIILNESAADVQFCDPSAAPGVVNPVLIDPTTGDLGPGPIESDGTIGGEETTIGDPTILGNGILTFGIQSPLDAAEFDFLVFVEEGAGDDEPNGSEPRFGTDERLGSGDPIEGAAETVTSVNCSPQNDLLPGGSVHNFRCVAGDAAGTGVTGALIAFDVVEGPNAEEVETTSCGVTDADGTARCSYTDAIGAVSPPGTDTIVGFVDLNPATSGPEVGAPRDRIHAQFLGAAATIKRVKSRLTLEKRFKGRVRAGKSVCKKKRKVVLKKVKKGRDRTVGRDKTNRRGVYKIFKRRAKGRYYTKMKHREVAKNGNIINCTKARSKTVKRRRR